MPEIELIIDQATEQKAIRREKAIEIFRLLNGFTYHEIEDIIEKVTYGIKNDLPIQVVF